ncbi:MAG: SPOR domain-containing protein [Cohaesibacter sp.]|jgi:hypothetical protein|nr:SPOR domain-containing protein [Cohaesibacter sp.]
MSDTNDKKPYSGPADWQSQAAKPQEGQAYGHASEDPLVELDRIVSGGQVDQSADFSTGTPSRNDDLRALEQELLRELRGEQAPLVQPTSPAAAPVVSAAEPLAPTPQAPEQPATQLLPMTFGQGGLSQPQEPAPQAAAPQAPQVQVSDFGQEAPSAPPVQNDPWADFSLSNDTPSDPAVEPQAQSGSYGQLSRGADTSGQMSAYSQPQDSAAAPVGPMASYSPAAPEPAYSPAPDVSAPSGAGAGLDPVSPDPLSSPSWTSAPVAEKPAEPAPSVSAYEPAAYQPQSPAPEPAPSYEPAVAPTPAYEPVAPQPSAPAVDPMAGYSPAGPSAAPASSESYVPVSSAPQGQADDPYAAFNQEPVAPQPSAPAVDPMAGYQPAMPSSDSHQSYTAPAVNVTGQAEPPAGYDASAYAASSYDNSGDVPPMASGPHGSYSDPQVAQAAAEAMPYLSEDGTASYHTEAQDVSPAQEAPAKSKKGLVVAAATLGIVVVGGLIAWGFGGSDDTGGETPVLIANSDPVKEAPQDPGGKVIPHQNKEVYDRIDGTSSDEGPGNLMPATEKPLAMTADGKNPRVISLSGGETSVPQSSSDGGASSANRSVASPKKVRTVIVRPDGTIVKSSDASSSAPSSTLSSVDQQMLASTPSEQAMSQTLDNGVGTASPAIAGQAGDETVQTSTLPKPKPAGLAAQQAANTVSNQIQQAVAPVVQAPRPANNTRQPLSLLPPANNSQARAPAQPAAPAQTANRGGYTVQVTSQRTPEQARASYANIQSRLSSVLGGYQPDIKRADLGAKGVYYRVRVGSFADRGGATNFCQSIKAAGGDCLVARQ